MTLSIRSTFTVFHYKRKEQNRSSLTSLHLSKNIIVNQLPFACPLLFYKDLHWAHSFLLYIIMTHHLFVLQTEIQMYVADSVIYPHGRTETQVNTNLTNSVVHVTTWLSLHACSIGTFCNPNVFYKEKRSRVRVRVNPKLSQIQCSCSQIHIYYMSTEAAKMYISDFPTLLTIVFFVIVVQK